MSFDIALKCEISLTIFVQILQIVPTFLHNTQHTLDSLPFCLFFVYVLFFREICVSIIEVMYAVPNIYSESVMLLLSFNKIPNKNLTSRHNVCIFYHNHNKSSIVYNSIQSSHNIGRH